MIDAANADKKFKVFLEDPTMPKAKKVKALSDFCDGAKFAPITKSFLVVVAENGRLDQNQKIYDALEEYTLADRLNLAVLGTPNLLEHELGFFVRGGDGLADLKPIAHLYKTQVYAMARHLGLPRAITAQMPTTDTYSLPQSQQEFYFGLPYPLLDLLLWCSREGIAPERAAPSLGMRPDEVARIGRDIDSKRRAAERLDGDALLAGDARRRNHRNGEEGNQ